MAQELDAAGDDLGTWRWFGNYSYLPCHCGRILSFHTAVEVVACFKKLPASERAKYADDGPQSYRPEDFYRTHSTK